MGVGEEEPIKKKKKEENKMAKLPHPHQLQERLALPPHFLPIIQIEGRPGTGSLHRTIGIRMRCRNLEVERTKRKIGSQVDPG